MIKFEFKRINQELATHYRPPAPVADSSARGTARTLPLDPAPMRTVPSGSSEHYPYCPVPLPHLPGQAVPPGHQTVTSSG
jgi:hypothetical protein